MTLPTPIPNHPAARHSPAAERNQTPIGEALLRLLPPTGLALEIASGSGQHAAHFSALLPGWLWQTSDPDAQALASITAWNPTGLPPLQLDVCQPDWALPASHQSLDLVFCANMLHISPWASCQGLMQGAGRHLKAGGLLVVYGPFILSDQDTAPSNLAFDADLRARDARWGLRELDAVKAEALEAGLELHDIQAMPANNLLLVFSRQPSNPKKAQA
ncbi:DUF938 domain-containing protein [Paucibacter sp. KCTC 42545]|uniref:DUF938 domain-containing protein n=1 Tax=Paucibacter sp. KCTC 42545 TaxID=1768242 RepID=UPI000733AF7F|nr:DUF938 domain-containing protein [Paucibacter sp. KCTC 42545]ALT77497.1 SAM-dependent methyltransferase [Paucibacter sp. KCTC 42545]